MNNGKEDFERGYSSESVRMLESEEGSTQCGFRVLWLYRSTCSAI